MSVPCSLLQEKDGRIAISQGMTDPAMSKFDSQGITAQAVSRVQANQVCRPIQIRLSDIQERLPRLEALFFEFLDILRKAQAR